MRWLKNMLYNLSTGRSPIKSGMTKRTVGALRGRAPAEGVAKDLKKGLSEGEASPA